MNRPHLVGDYVNRVDGASEEESKHVLRLKVEWQLKEDGINADEYTFEYVMKDETIGYKGTLKDQYR